jgi:hypothetical protein
MPLLAGCAVPRQGLSPEADLVLCRQQLSLLTSRPTISMDDLSRRSASRLREVASDIRAQRQTLAEVEGFVGWMSTNLAGYAKYVEAGNMVTAIARVLPIPYAGQASLFTKFVSSGLLSLNSASVSLNQYLSTSQKFLVKVDALGTGTPDPAVLADAVTFADGLLLRDMNDARGKLTRTSEISSSTLAFLEALHGYTKSTDEYLSKTKSLLRRDGDKQEKSFLSENIGALRSRASGFDSRLRLFEANSRRSELAIKAVVAYTDLRRDLAGTVAP